MPRELGKGGILTAEDGDCGLEEGRVQTKLCLESDSAGPEPSERERAGQVSFASERPKDVPYNGRPPQWRFSRNP